MRIEGKDFVSMEVTEHPERVVEIIGPVVIGFLAGCFVWMFWFA